MKIKFFCFSLIFLIFIGAVSIYSFFFFFHDYEDFIQLLLPYTHSEHQVSKLKNHFLTPFKFEVLKYFLLFFLIFIFTAVYWIFINQHTIISQIKVRYALYKITLLEIFSSIKSLKKVQKILLITILLTFTLLRLYFAFHYSLTYDEIYIWEELVQRGILVSLSYYPIHGNHILHTLIVNVFSFFEPFKALRLPSLWFSFLLDFFLFIWLYHQSHHFVKSCCGLILFNLLYVNWIHSFLGRGYVLGLLLSFILLVIYEKRWYFRFFYETLLLQILLLYTLPSGCFFLIPFWILSPKNLLWKNILITGLLIIIFYLPVFFFLNPQDLLSGAYYQKKTLSRIHEVF